MNCTQSPSTSEESAAVGDASAEAEAADVVAAAEPEQRFVTLSLLAGTEMMKLK